MNANEKTTLLYLLGYVDGTREPQPLSGDSWQADQQAAQAFRESGAIHIGNPGNSAAEKKRFDRAVTALESQGVIFRHGREIGLTPLGHTTARNLAGLPTVDQSLDLLAAIHDHPDKWDHDYVSESSLTGGPAYMPGRVGEPRIDPDHAAVLLAHAAPLFLARLAQWRDVAAHDALFLYRCTTEGQTQAVEGDSGRWFKRIAKPTRFTLPEAYSEGWQTAFQARQSAKPPRPNLVHHQDLVDPPTARKQNRPKGQKETRP